MKPKSAILKDKPILSIPNIENKTNIVAQLYNVDWKDKQGNKFKDCLFDFQLRELQNNPNIEIIKFKKR
jgi:hypothetical protein